MVTLKINDKEIPMIKIKTRLWMEIMKFNDESREAPAAEAIEKYCNIIARAFGVTADDILDNLDIEEVMPKYFEILKSMGVLLTLKLPKKNADAEVTAQA